MKRRGFGTRQARAAAATTLVLLASGVVFASPALAFGSPNVPTPPMPSVSAGGYMTCGVQANTEAACWGRDNAEGAFGMATPPADVLFKEVNTGYSHACGVEDTGEDAGPVRCWGGDFYGETSPPTGNFTHVVAGLDNSCGIRTDKTLACWGLNYRPGDPAEEFPLPGGTFTQLSLGARHGCALNTEGAVQCWGSNAYSIQTGAPVGPGYIQITSGNFDSCTIDTNKMVRCWGRNAFQQATTVPQVPFEQVSAGFGHVCGIEPGGSVRCWGRDREGQTIPPTGMTFKTISAGTFHTCGVNTADKVVCWGSNAAGRVTPIIVLRERISSDGKVGEPYSLQLRLTYLSPRPDIRLASGALPPGLTLDSVTGEIKGTPTVAGTFTNITLSIKNELSPEGTSEPFEITIFSSGRGGGSPGHGGGTPGHGGHGGHGGRAGG